MSPAKSSKGLTDEEVDKFDWISLKQEMDAALPTETQSQKLARKFKENPFVPVGKKTVDLEQSLENSID